MKGFALTAGKHSLTVLCIVSTNSTLLSDPWNPSVTIRLKLARDARTAIWKRLTVEKARSQQFYDSFLIRAVRTRNNLPDTVVNSSSLTSFCTKLELVLKQRGFY
ncbi:hypothetical protein Y032_0013g2141 [Ancylostoma ceylanicum]|nr:hypothetical protein Y032_0013g2141 [Ancylostoma ceylanicum]